MYPCVAAVSAVTGLGKSWPTTWQALLRAEQRCVLAHDVAIGHEMADVPVCAVRDLDRMVDGQGRGAAYRLLSQALSSIKLSYEEYIRIYGGSNHGESDLLACLRDGPTLGQARSLFEDNLPAMVQPPMRWTYAACSSGTHALASALLDFVDGLAEDILIAAVDALSVLELVGFKRVGAVTRSGEIPFSENRDGILIGEGAAVLRLTAFGQNDDVRIVGFGLTCDARHPTDPDPSGVQLENAIRRALSAAKLSVTDIEAIVAHGTGTTKNDLAEAQVFQRIWPDAGVRVTSVKAAMGHTMGAAGLFNVLVAVEGCRSGVLPPIGPAGYAMLPGVDFVVGAPRPITPGRAILAIASGFGGNNAVVAVRGGCA